MQIRTDIDDYSNGQLVIIGSSRKTGSVLMRHTAFGEEFDLLDQVQIFQAEKMKLLAVRAMTTGEVEQFSKKHWKSWHMGYWFKRSAAIERAVEAINIEASASTAKRSSAQPKFGTNDVVPAFNPQVTGIVRGAQLE